MYGQLALEKLNKKEKFVWENQKLKKLTYQNSNILSLNVFHRLIALSELNSMARQT